ncbi:hypothetical protein [Dyadobacter bucti]|uniref:hypothetical protein n=1 Tax=Dyadobacter bucti TaxID=2572203 RepID=UPI003F6EAB8B
MAISKKSSLIKLALASIIFVFPKFVLGQQSGPNLGTNPFGDKYRNEQLSALKMVDVMEAVTFRPVKRTNDVKLFQSALLQLPNEAYEQTSRDTWYLCSYKHEENYRIYNIFYKPVSKDIYTEKCKCLVGLMLLDGTVIQPK